MTEYWSGASHVFESMDKLIEQWHTTDTTMPLNEYLRLSLEEYRAWVTNVYDLPKDYLIRFDDNYEQRTLDE